MTIGEAVAMVATWWALFTKILRSSFN